MTTPAPPPPPPPPPPSGPGDAASTDPSAERQRRSWPRRVLRAVLLGLGSGLVAAIAFVFWVSGSVGPAPESAEVCREVPSDALDDPTPPGVEVAIVCGDIDTNLNRALGGIDGFEGVFRAPDPPSAPQTVRPDYLVWETDGCSAPVIGAGPFDFTLACTRHDFGWRNLKEFDSESAPIWQVDNKDRVDAGFLYDMRAQCSSIPALIRFGCDTTARIYYTAVRLNPAGVEALPGR